MALLPVTFEGLEADVMTTTRTAAERRYCDECSYAAAHGEPVFADCPKCGVNVPAPTALPTGNFATDIRQATSGNPVAEELVEQMLAEPDIYDAVAEFRERVPPTSSAPEETLKALAKRIADRVGPFIVLGGLSEVASDDVTNEIYSELCKTPLHARSERAEVLEYIQQQRDLLLRGTFTDRLREASVLSETIDDIREGKHLITTEEGEK